MAVRMQEGNLPHIYWIDLKGDGVFVECAVMKKDGLGNVYFFPLKALDSIDKRRLHRILTNRNAVNFELWDLMSNITLNNGVNALTYFHQLVEMITPSGRTMKPQQGVVGVEGVIDTRGADARRDMEAAATAAANAAAQAAASAAAAAVQAATGAAVPNLQQHAPAPAPQPLTEAAPAPAPAPKKRSPRKKAAE